jgi:hypothetical protein
MGGETRLLESNAQLGFGFAQPASTGEVEQAPREEHFLSRSRAGTRDARGKKLSARWGMEGGRKASEDRDRLRNGATSPFLSMVHGVPRQRQW